MHKKCKIFNLKAFTLLDLLLGAAILAFVLCGFLYSFISCLILNETNRKFSLAYNAIQIKMEELKNTGFDNLSDGTFSLTGSGFTTANSKGVIDVTDTGSDLKKIKIFACFTSRGRLIGSGSIDNCTSSPVKLVTYIARTQ